MQTVGRVAERLCERQVGQQLRRHHPAASGRHYQQRRNCKAPAGPTVYVNWQTRERQRGSAVEDEEENAERCHCVVAAVHHPGPLEPGRGVEFSGRSVRSPQGTDVDIDGHAHQRAQRVREVVDAHRRCNLERISRLRTAADGGECGVESSESVCQHQQVRHECERDGLCGELESVLAEVHRRREGETRCLDRGRRRHRPAYFQPCPGRLLPNSLTVSALVSLVH